MDLVAAPRCHLDLEEGDNLSVWMDLRHKMFQMMNKPQGFNLNHVFKVPLVVVFHLALPSSAAQLSSCRWVRAWILGWVKAQHLQLARPARPGPGSCMNAA